jgi:hypothetical protein
MATTQVVKVNIEELSKYGFKANGKYVGLSKQLSEADKTRLVPGAQFEAEYYVADSGKEYLNKILSSSSSKTVVSKVQAPEARPKGDPERAKRFTPKFNKSEAKPASETMTKADWNVKDRNMMIGGRSHDAAVIVAAMVNTQIYTVPELLDVYKEVLTGMLEIAAVIK